MIKSYSVCMMKYECPACNHAYDSLEQATECFKYGNRMKRLKEAWNKKRLLWHLVINKNNNEQTWILPSTCQFFNNFPANSCISEHWAMNDINSRKMYESHEYNVDLQSTMTLGEAWRNHGLSPVFANCLKNMEQINHFMWSQLFDFHNDTILPYIEEYCRGLQLQALYEISVNEMLAKIWNSEKTVNCRKHYAYPNIETIIDKRLKFPDLPARAVEWD